MLQDAVDAVTMLSIRDILDHIQVAALIGVSWTVSPVASALLLFKLLLFAQIAQRILQYSVGINLNT